MIERRPFGLTGHNSTRTLFGAAALGRVTQAEADSTLEVLLQYGVNHIDTAASYGDAELRIGPWMEQHRGDFFLATKTGERTYQQAREEFHRSLERLRVDQVDLIQLHNLVDPQEWEVAMGPGGALEAVVEAREEGLVRFIGVTGHADPVVVRQSFERWPFDTVLLPLNCVDPHHLSFEKETLPKAVAKGLGRLGMKAFASGNLVKHGIEANACLRYAYGLDVSTVVVGCRTVEEVDAAVCVARENQPFSAEEKKALLEKTKPHHGKDVEWYKRA